MRHVNRAITHRVLESLSDTRIVVVQGARQVGKSTLVASIVDQVGGRAVTLDDDVVRSTARADPAGFVAQFPAGLLAIDEVQRVPELVLALKLAVDRDPRPGRFLLTGSADLVRLPATEDSLAGRAESVELFGFSQGELNGHPERFIDRLIEGERFLGHTSEHRRIDYLARAAAGSYPEVLARSEGPRRRHWIDNYLVRIVERDAPDVSRLHRLGDLPRILRVLAARNSQELNLADVARDTGIPVRTLAPHIDLLETLYLVQRIPAWSTNLTQRAVSRPKVSVIDSAIAARLMNYATSPGLDRGVMEGQLLEGFVAGELRRQRGWATTAVQICHYRDHDGGEVDFIVEADDGRIAGLEVKAASSVGARDARWLSRLRDRAGERFVSGLVLHTGASAGPLGDRLAAVPLDALWTT